jgi:hypothetical protein
MPVAQSHSGGERSRDVLAAAQRGPGDLIPGLVVGDVQFASSDGNFSRCLKAEFHPVAADPQNDNRDLFVDPDFLPRLARKNQHDRLLSDLCVFILDSKLEGPRSSCKQSADLNENDVRRGSFIAAVQRKTAVFPGKNSWLLPAAAREKPANC